MTKWLTPAERRLAELRMEEDAGVSDEVSDCDSITELPFDDRRTSMNLVGGVSGWRLTTGRDGG